MILLDSDHLTVFRFRTSDRAVRLADRLAKAADPMVGTTIANVEEAMRGWLAAIAKERQVHRQIHAYTELTDLFGFFAGFYVAPFEEVAADRFVLLRTAKLRIGTMDMKTASIALAYSALLLTANRRDFEKVPGLRFENWLDPI